MSCVVMGVLNVTPDSFSDGGRWSTADEAIAHGLRLVAEGADIVDMGGESTRPGAEPVDEAAELEPGDAGGRGAGAARAGVDRHRQAGRGRGGVAAGATIVNDVTRVAARRRRRRSASGWIAMHMQGTPRTMQDDAHL